ncbi:cupin domain-containing protein [Myxococcaceae bacterium GXIMD 01537]
MRHVDDILPELLLGTLEGSLQREVERHLGGCARCQQEAARLAPALRGLAASVAPVAPPPGVLTSLVAGMEGPGRLARFGDEVARFFDIGRERALTLLESLSDPGVWMPYHEPGVDFLFVEAGPARVGQVTAFARLAPDRSLSHHAHAGREQTLVLEGGLREEPGGEVWPGEVLEKPAGSEHSLTALPGRPCLVAFAEEMDVGGDTP